MEYLRHGTGRDSLVEFRGSETLVRETGDILDLIGEAASRGIILRAEQLHPDFFRLSTGFAGEVLQKFSNYGTSLAIVGDFSGYTSKPLRDFIGESNRTGQVVFVATVEEALMRLGAE